MDIDLLKVQYALVCSSRNVVLDFVAQSAAQLFKTPVPEFADKSIRYQLVHNANVYNHWLANFAMQQNLDYAFESDFDEVLDLKKFYNLADKQVEEFLNHYQDRLNDVITGVTSSGRIAQATPLQLFTHTITHEFHHKGQILSMATLLGHIPPDADVIRF